MVSFYSRSMAPVEQIVRISFFQGLPAEALREVAADSTAFTMEPGRILFSQNDVAETVYFLISGVVQFFIRFQGVDDLMVGTMQEPGALLGWSVFRPPYRYTATVRCEEECQILRVSRASMADLLESEPRLGYVLLKRVAVSLANRLEQTGDLLVRTPATGEMPSAGA